MYHRPRFNMMWVLPLAVSESNSAKCPKKPTSDNDPIYVPSEARAAERRLFITCIKNTHRPFSNSRIIAPSSSLSYHPLTVSTMSDIPTMPPSTFKLSRHLLRIIQEQDREKFMSVRTRDSLESKLAVISVPSSMCPARNFCTQPLLIAVLPP